MQERLYLSHAELDAAAADDVQAYVADAGFRFAGRSVPDQGQFDFGDRGQQMRAASVVLVLLTDSMPEDEVVAREIDASLDLAMGLVVLRMDEHVDVPQHLWDTGAEVLNWTSAVDLDYLPIAIDAARKGAVLLEKAAQRGSGSGAACARPPRH